VSPQALLPNMMVGDEPELWWIFIPSFEEGTMRRSREMERYLRNGAARGGQTTVSIYASV
jgi:hypothetical protein